MQIVTSRWLTVIGLVVLVALAAALLPASTASAQTGPATTGERTVRLVERPDGTLEVQRGPVFAATSGRLVAKEQDVVLQTTGILADLLDVTTGLITDPLRRDQWNLDAVQAEAAWQRSTGDGQVIAIIDSGVDGDHLDLRDRMVPGFSALGGDPAVDGHGHGTHVAGTAAASIDGQYGVAGLAPDARIMPVQVTDAEGMAYSSDVAEGLIWAVSNGATVANMSLAGTRESSVLSAAIDYAVANGVVVVVAGGNEFQRGNPVTHPAAHPGVIAVAAMSDGTTRSSFSSSGDWIDIAAPGSSILSTRPGGTFGRSSGTSMAAPLVAGAVAVLRAARPDLGVEDVRALLLDQAADRGAAGWDAEFGHGALDVLAALEQITDAPVVEVPEIPEVTEPPAPSPVPADVAHFQRG